MVYPHFGTRNCSWLGLVVGISEAFVGSKCRNSDDNSCLCGYWGRIELYWRRGAHARSFKRPEGSFLRPVGWAEAPCRFTPHQRPDPNFHFCIASLMGSAPVGRLAPANWPKKGSFWPFEGSGVGTAAPVQFNPAPVAAEAAVVVAVAAF